MVVKCDVNGPHILNDGKKTLFKQRHKRQYGYTCVLWRCWLADSEGIWNVESSISRNQQFLQVHIRWPDLVGSMWSAG